MLIRSEQAADWDAVRAVNVSAFETPSESNLVDSQREQVQPLVSVVAETNGAVIGYILFSPVSLSGSPDLKVMGLAPMAVSPEHQQKGVGSALVRAGLEQCRKLGVDAIVVLGHSAYYPRFGFVPSSRFGIDSEYDVPEEAFMVMELKPESLKGMTGRVKYHAAFGSL